MAGLGDSLLVCPLGLCRDGTFPPFHLRGKGDSSLLRPVWGPEGCQGSGCSRHREAVGDKGCPRGSQTPLGTAGATSETTRGWFFKEDTNWIREMVISAK